MSAEALVAPPRLIIHTSKEVPTPVMTMAAHSKDAHNSVDMIHLLSPNMSVKLPVKSQVPRFCHTAEERISAFAMDVFCSNVPKVKETMASTA